LLAIIEDILDISKIEANKVTLTKEEFEIVSVITDILHMFSYAADESGIELTYSLDPDIPAAVLGDRERIGQVLRNLVSNAMKFTQEGSIRIVVLKERTADDRVHLRFEVTDTGIGIESGKADKLFQSFYQVETDFSKEKQGTGLGLAISKRIIEMMGGSIGVESVPGKGSTFFFVVPFETIELRRERKEPREKLETEIGGPAVWNVQVLLAEDSFINQLYVSELLRKNGYNVITARNGFEAMDKVEKEKVDIVLMDIQMPDFDGLSAAKELRKKYTRDDLPILALTAYVLQEELDVFLQAGMNDYITKPIDERKLLEKVAAYSANRG
jgi:CheY-like chemotaxis protein